MCSFYHCWTGPVKDEFIKLIQSFKLAWNSCRSFLGEQGKADVLDFYRVLNRRNSKSSRSIFQENGTLFFFHTNPHLLLAITKYVTIAIVKPSKKAFTFSFQNIEVEGKQLVFPWHRAFALLKHSMISSRNAVSYFTCIFWRSSPSATGSMQYGNGQ